MSAGDPSNNETELEALRRRMELLERDNQRLRDKLEPLIGPDNPCFDPQLFQRTLQRYILLAMIPLWAFTMLFPLAMLPMLPFRGMFTGWKMGPIPIVDLAGSSSGIPGMGLGVIAMGGVSVGIFAFGGMAVGLVAIGGGAVGIIALGGGSVGVIAIGGGAIGYIAVGGGAFGRYALGGRAHGTFAFGINRQDPEAVEFFVRYLPRLRNAITSPMPVILRDAAAQSHASTGSG